jgi:superfamily I DNA/RNA helicase
MRVPGDYRAQHLGVASLVGRDLKGETLSELERGLVATALDVSVDELDQALSRNDDPEEVSVTKGLFGEGAGLSEPTEPEPVKTILCTTLQGAKGLSAEHVFIVGLMGGHLPRDNANPTDREICEFLVALSRTRTACHLVSARQFGPPPKGRRAPPRLPVSRFVEWVAPQSHHVDVAARDLPAVPKGPTGGRARQRAKGL